MCDDMTEQETIEQSILGKRIVAVSWLPIERGEIWMSLEKITLEGGTVLELWASDYDNIVFANVEESEDANSERIY